MVLSILDPIKNIRASWEEVKISTLTGFWKTSGEEVTADVAERARELELDAKPEDAPGLLQSHGKTLMGE